MIIMISLPMAIGLALLCKPVWNIFYGLSNDYGPMILSLSVFVTLMGNIFMITSSTLQALNKFSLVYKSFIVGLLTNIILDIPLMILFHKIGIPPFLGAQVSSIIGYSISLIYSLYTLKKEHNLEYQNTYHMLQKLIIPIILMIAGVLVFKHIIPINYDSKISSIIYVAINSIVGCFIYIFTLYKNNTLNEVLGSALINKFLNKLTFGKVKIK